MRVDENGTKWWDWLISIGSIVCGIVLCVTGVGAGVGAGLIVTGGLSLTTNILSAAGVNSKTVSIVSSVISIATGLIMLATPLAGVGASLIGSGIGGIGGGLLAERLGFSFTTGAAIGSFIGGIVGGVTYKTLQNAGRISFKTSIKKIVENPLDPYSQEFIGPKQGEVVRKIQEISQTGIYDAIDVKRLANGLLEIQDGHHTFKALLSLGYKYVKVVLVK